MYGIAAMAASPAWLGMGGQVFGERGIPGSIPRETPFFVSPEKLFQDET